MGGVSPRIEGTARGEADKENHDAFSTTSLEMSRGKTDGPKGRLGPESKKEIKNDTRSMGGVRGSKRGVTEAGGVQEQLKSTLDFRNDGKRRRVEKF